VPSLVESQHPSFRQLLHAADRVQITWLSLPENSPLIGKTLRESNIRARTGASVVAIIRQKQVIANPKSITAFEQGDQIGFIGEESQIQSLENLIHGHGREPGIDASEVI
jgi:CPA2 family monovalent cation:H+ antiporter-2